MQNSVSTSTLHGTLEHHSNPSTVTRLKPWTVASQGIGKKGGLATCWFLWLRLNVVFQKRFLDGCCCRAGCCSAGREPPGSLRELLLKLPLLNPSHASDRPAHITITGGTYAALPIVVFDNVRITVELGSELRFAYGDAWNRSTAGDAGAAVGGAGEGGSGLQRPHIGCLGCSNVTLEGPGAIDGDGEPWWEALDPWKLAENPKVFIHLDTPCFSPSFAAPTLPHL